MRLMISLMTLAAALVLAAVPAQANPTYEAGVAAYDSQNFRAAFNSFLESARDDDHHEAQIRLGRMYTAGRGTAQDLVRGYMWLTVAYLRGDMALSDELAEIRLEMTEQQIVASERLAIEWVVGEEPTTEDLYQLEP